MNKCLYKVLQLTPLVFDILLRFRRAQVIALTTDVEKAFHQITVDNNDRDYLRFLRLGNISSTIRKHVNHYSDDPEFENKTLKSFFIDDLISGE